MKKIILLMVLLTMCSTTALAKGGDSKEKNLENSISILKELGASINSIPKIENDSSNPGKKKINFNKTSYALLDNENRIVKIDRFEEVSDDSFRKKVNKKDYKFIQSLVEKKLIKKGYKLINSGEFDDVTVALRYEKVMANGGHNQYDAYDVYIDKENGALVSFIKKGVERQETPKNSEEKVITKEQAKKIANEFLKKYNLEVVKDIKIGTIIPNSYFVNRIKGIKTEDDPVIVNEENIEKQNIVEAYILESESLEIYVDMHTGDILGGDFYKSEQKSIVGIISFVLKRLKVIGM